MITTIMVSCSSEPLEDEIKLIPVKSGDLYSYINYLGEVVIRPQFLTAEKFKEKRALVSLVGEYPLFGYIAEDGKYVITPQYISATSFSEGLAWVVAKDETPKAIDKDGKVQFQIEDDKIEMVGNFKNGLAPFMIKDKKFHPIWGFMNKLGKVVINPKFHKVLDFSEGKCAVMEYEGVWGRTGKWGFIDVSGNYINDIKYEECSSYQGGLSIVSVLEYSKVGVIDENGDFVVNPTFQGIERDGEYLKIKKNAQYGWMDLTGQIIISPQFQEAGSFNNSDLAPVSIGDKLGYVNRKGNIVINPQFENIQYRFLMRTKYDFIGDIAPVLVGSKYGFIDKKGAFVVNPQYDDVSTSTSKAVDSDKFSMNYLLDVLYIDKAKRSVIFPTFGEFMEKYDLEEETFKTGTFWFELRRTECVFKDFCYYPYIAGQPFDKLEVKTGSGWYEKYETKYKFNPTRKTTALAFVFENERLDDYETQLIINEIVMSLPNLEKSESSAFIQSYTGNRQVFTNDQVEVIFEYVDGKLSIILIDKKIAEQ